MADEQNAELEGLRALTRDHMKHIKELEQQLREARALLEEAMRAGVGAASPEISDEVARFEFWRTWSERVRAYLSQQQA